MAVIDDVKTMLGESGNSLDGKLNIIIAAAEKRLLSYLPGSVLSVPGDLEYIVTEIAISRYNRVGNEGMDSYSQEGESISYGDDISPYEPDIEAWIRKQEGSCEGKVMFL